MKVNYIALTKYPDGPLAEENFDLRSREMAGPRDGEILVRPKLLSIDPYLRGILAAKPMFGDVLQLGSAVPGRGIGEVVESRVAGIETGQFLLGDFGWQDHAVVQPDNVRIVPRLSHPLSWHLGVLGMPGITALLALEMIGAPRAGETVFVSSAAGGVGSAAGQIAKSLGCVTIGSTSTSKMKVCSEVFKFDHCIDRGAPGGLSAQIERLGSGIDVALDNVGDEVLSAVLPLMQPGGRVILCGRIADYDRATAPAAASSGFVPVLFKQLRVQGFNVRAHIDKFGKALERLRSLADRGELTQVDSISRGLESAPRTLCGLFDGRYVGKVLVEL